MTHRPLLWLSALGAALGAVATVPTPAGAQSLVWNVTIETADKAEDHLVEVAGDAELFGGVLPVDVETVTITLSERVDLPGACEAPPPVTRAVEDDRYDAEISVPCNGPYEIAVVANARGGSSTTPARRNIGVEAKPLPPPKPTSVATGSGVRVSWERSPHPDALGWVLVTAGGDLAFTADQLKADLGPGLRGSTLGMKAVHWGAEGPTGPTIASDPGGFTLLASGGGQTQNTDPQNPSTIPETSPSIPGGPGATVPSSSTSPPGTSPPSRGTGSTQPLPEGYTPELPFGTRPEAFVPGSTPATDPADGVEQASGARAPTGLVRTTEKTSPGLVAPFALALMMLTIAAHIAWYLRRSRPGGGGRVGGGQVRPA